MSRNKYLAQTLGHFLVLMLLLLPEPARGAGVAIEPVRQELELSAGQAFSNNQRVRNSGTKATTVHLKAQAFNVINENYDYSFEQSEDIKRATEARHVR